VEPILEPLISTGDTHERDQKRQEGGKLGLSVNKENLKHLKVRTDLKGGLLAQLAVAKICSGCHGCG
jgi:hypothetical protein